MELEYRDNPQSCKSELNKGGVHKTIKQYYVGCTGIRYPKEEYSNHGYGGIKKGLKDLPNNQHPYRILDVFERYCYFCRPLDTENELLNT